MPWLAGAHICRCLRRPGIDSSESIPIPGLIKRLQIWAQSPYLKNVKGAQESIPRNRFRQPMYPGWSVRQIVITARQAGTRFLGSLKGLQIRAQATLASKISSLESIPRIHNMKNEDEDRSEEKQIYSYLN